MYTNRIWLSSPHMNGTEINYINDAFSKNIIAPLGENVDNFEKSVAEYVGMNHGAALVSGTSAIHLALKSLGVGTGDLVFCSSLTFGATCFPIKYLGAEPVFIDSDLATMNMCPIALEKAYAKFSNPKAIIIVDLYGQSADYDKLKPIIARHGTPIIEDAAESLGATYNNTKSGSFGDIGILSFNGNKIITTSGGGMLLSNNEHTINKVRFWSTQSRDAAPYYQHSEIGYNYRMSNIVAGIGRGQMKTLDQRVSQKTAIFRAYKKAFSHIPQLSMANLDTDTNKSMPNYWLSVLTIDPKSKIKPKNIIQTLADCNVESRHVWKPMNMQPVFANNEFFSSKDVGTSVGEQLFNDSICLPSDSKMSEEDLLRVTTAICKLFDI